VKVQFYEVTNPYRAIFDHSSKNALFGHYTFTHLVVDGAARMAFLANLSNFQ
jgi:hypothetical protein